MGDTAGGGGLRVTTLDASLELGAKGRLHSPKFWGPQMGKDKKNLEARDEKSLLKEKEKEKLVYTDEIEDPFVCFDEWASEEDDEAFAHP